MGLQSSDYVTSDVVMYMQTKWWCEELATSVKKQICDCEHTLVDMVAVVSVSFVQKKIWNALPGL